MAAAISRDAVFNDSARPRRERIALPVSPLIDMFSFLVAKAATI
jgi:hypothetical protein